MSKTACWATAGPITVTTSVQQCLVGACKHPSEGPQPMPAKPSEHVRQTISYCTRVDWVCMRSWWYWWPHVAGCGGDATVAPADVTGAGGLPHRPCIVSASLHALPYRYKAYFRWQHYPHKRPDLPVETEACASVTSAFLQVRFRMSRPEGKPRLPASRAIDLRAGVHLFETPGARDAAQRRIATSR